MYMRWHKKYEILIKYRPSQKWRTNGALKVALNRSIILKYMYEIVMTATSNRKVFVEK
jgi:hypothetical protein